MVQAYFQRNLIPYNIVLFWCYIQIFFNKAGLDFFWKEDLKFFKGREKQFGAEHSASIQVPES